MPPQMYEGNYNFPYNECEIDMSGYPPVCQDTSISISAVISASCSVIVDDPHHYITNTSTQISTPQYPDSEVMNCCEGQVREYYEQNIEPRMQMCNYNGRQYGTPDSTPYVNEYPIPCNDQYGYNNNHVENSSQSDFAESTFSEEYAGSDIPAESGAVQSLVEVNVDEMLSNGITVAGYKPRRMIQKRKKTKTPNESRNRGYWDKRRKNNDSARRSREAKKEKERNFYKRALELEYENFQLKEKVAYLEEQLLSCSRLNGSETCCYKDGVGIET